MGADLLAAPLVGRDRELGILVARLDAALRGEGGVALVGGDPGIGKTRLVEELGRVANERGARLLWGRSYDEPGAPPFWPWSQIVRALLRGTDGDALCAALGPAAEAAARLADGAGAAPAVEPIAGADDDPDRERFRLFENVAALLAAAAERVPLVLALDDLHLADEASLRLLQFLARGLGSSRLLVVGGYCESGDEQGRLLAGVLASLRRQRGFLDLPLAGLAPGAVEVLAAALNGSAPIAAELIAVLQAESEGNPFFVEELLRHLRRGGDPASVPVGVRELIEDRLTRLSAPCRDTLSFAAVLGREFELVALERAAELSAATLLDLLDEAETAHVVRPAAEQPGRYRFEHALVRETLYAALPGARRAALHAQVGEALSSHFGDAPDRLAEVAHHLLAAGPVVDGRHAASAAHRAGERALALLAYEDAAGLFGRALWALETAGAGAERERLALLLLLGEARSRAGDADAAAAAYREAFDRAAARGDAEGQARAALGLAGRGFHLHERDAPFVAALEQAYAALGDVESPLRAAVCARRAFVRHVAGRVDEAYALSGAAVAMARSSGDLAVLAAALSARHVVLRDPAYLEERLRVADEVVQIAERSGDRELLLRGYEARIVDSLELGDVAAFDATLVAYARRAEAMRQPYELSNVALWRCTRALLDGRVDDAERQAHEALALGQRAGRSDAVTWFGSQIVGVRYAQGRLAEMEPVLRGIARQFPDVLGLQCTLPWLYAELGRRQEAAREFERLARNDFADVPRDPGRAVALTLLARACVVVGDARRAGLLSALLEPYAGQVIVAARGIGCQGIGAETLAWLAAVQGHWDDAMRLVDEAATLTKRMGLRYWRAWADASRAGLLAERGRPEERSHAADLAGEALAVARSLGVVALERRALAVQAAVALTGSPSELDAGQAVLRQAGLSTREIEVLRLLAEGRTNREIAAALVLSPATVQSHTIHIYQKIGARGRTEATAFALRHGLASAPG